MTALAYVVVSTPRSGTKYMARLLDVLGLNCTHEKYFAPFYHKHQEHGQKIFGDASWFAAPFLTDLAKTTVIFHQLRDPVLTINSLLYTKHLRLTEYASDPAVAFIRRHTPFSNPELPEEELAGIYWRYWHTLIEQSSTGRRYIRYKIEDLAPDYLCELLRVLGVSVSHRRAVAALQAVSKTVNSRGRPPTLVSSRTLPLDARNLAIRYGYSY